MNDNLMPLTAIEDEPYILSLESYLKIRHIYWVLAPKDDDGRIRWGYWLNSAAEPPPPIYHGNYWRHPTYEEANYRQIMFEKYPSRYIAGVLPVERRQPAGY